MSNLKAKTTDADAAIGSRIKLSRVRNGVSQEALAYHLGISFQQVQKYENGKNRLSASALCVVADFLGVSALWLLRGSETDADAPPPAPMDAVAVKASLIMAGLSPRAKHAAMTALRAIAEVDGETRIEAEAA